MSDESHDFEDVECEICIMRSIEIALPEFQNHVGKRHFECTLDKVINPDGEAKASYLSINQHDFSLAFKTML